MSKKLVAYFSASGVTAKAAEKLAKAADTVIKEGKLLNGSISEAELRAWTKEIAEQGVASLEESYIYQMCLWVLTSHFISYKINDTVRIKKEHGNEQIRETKSKRK